MNLKTKTSIYSLTSSLLLIFLNILFFLEYPKDFFFTNIIISPTIIFIILAITNYSTLNTPAIAVWFLRKDYNEKQRFTNLTFRLLFVLPISLLLFSIIQSKTDGILALTSTFTLCFIFLYYEPYQLDILLKLSQ